MSYEEVLPQRDLPTAKLSGLASRKMALALAVICLTAGALLLIWHGPLPFEGLMRDMINRDASGPLFLALASTPEKMRRTYGLSIGTALSLLGLLILAGTVWVRLNQRLQNIVYTWIVTLASSCALMVHLLRVRTEAPWLPISVVLKNPAELPIIGHRLLFVWIAEGFQIIVPHLSDLKSFYLSQALAILLAMYALAKWSALHIGNSLSWLGPILGAVLISTCFSYYNFADIAHVFFTTCGLIAIYTRSYWWLVPVVLIGTLNYEGLLLLIPVAAFAAFDQDAPKQWIPPVAIALLTYSAVRFALQAAIPIASHLVEWRMWTNITDIFRSEIWYSVLALAGWYAAGLLSLADCNPRLKRLILLFPLVLAVTFLFGQFHEPRQFDAFIPVLVAMILSAARRRFQVEAYRLGNEPGLFPVSMSKL